MATSTLNELEEFHRFVGDQVRQRNDSLSPEAAVELFRQRQMSPDAFADSVAAVQRALAQADRGEGIPLAQAMEQLRQKHAIPELANDA